MSSIDETSDRAWAALAPHLSGKARDVRRTGTDNWRFLTRCSGLPATGVPKRALPARFGKHATLRKRSRHWAQKGIWQRSFEAVREPDLDWVLLDSSVVRAHAQAAGSRKNRVGDEAFGRSRGGLTTKLHVLVDAPDNPLPVVIGPGQRADCRRAADLLAAAEGVGNGLAGKAYDPDAVVAAVQALGAQVVIPSRKNRKVVRLIDRNLYRDRNKVEHFFSRLKQLRRWATRYEKTASSFLAMVHFVSVLPWLR